MSELENGRIPQEEMGLKLPKNEGEKEVIKKVPSAQVINEIGKKLFPDAVLYSEDGKDDYPYFSGMDENGAQVAVYVEDGKRILVVYDVEQNSSEYFPVEFGVDGVVRTAGSIDKKMKLMKECGLDPQLVGDYDLRKYLHGELTGAVYTVGKKTMKEADYTGKLIEIYKRYFNNEIDLENGYAKHFDEPKNSVSLEVDSAIRPEPIIENNSTAVLIEEQREKIQNITDQPPGVNVKNDVIEPVAAAEDLPTKEKPGFFQRIRNFFT